MAQPPVDEYDVEEDDDDYDESDDEEHEQSADFDWEKYKKEHGIASTATDDAQKAKLSAVAEIHKKKKKRKKSTSGSSDKKKKSKSPRGGPRRTSKDKTAAKAAPPAVPEKPNKPAVPAKPETPTKPTPAPRTTLAAPAPELKPPVEDSGEQRTPTAAAIGGGSAPKATVIELVKKPDAQSILIQDDTQPQSLDQIRRVIHAEPEVVQPAPALSFIRHNKHTGEKFELDGRFQFECIQDLPPPPKWQGVPKVYNTKGPGSKVDWEATERWRLLREG